MAPAPTRLSPGLSKASHPADVAEKTIGRFKSLQQPACSSHVTPNPFTGTSRLVKPNWFYVVDDLGADSELMDEQAALKSVTKEQTASLQTALLHGHIGLVCGPRCEPLSGVSIPIPWTSTSRATKG